MKKYNNIFLTLMMVLSLILMPIQSYASENLNGDSAGDIEGLVLSEKEQIAIGLEGVESQEQLDNLLMKKALLETKPVRASYIATTIAVPYFQQENGYYCGPATTKQTIHYITGSSSSQATIAQALGTTTAGTDGTRIVDYLNSKQNSIYYMICDDTSISGLQLRIALAIGSTKPVKWPPITRVRFTQGGNWKYTTEGHFMNISGYTANMEKVRITDPNIGRVITGHSGTYEVSMSEIHKAINEHWAQHMYW